MEDILSFDFFILDSIQQSMRCDFLDSVAAAIGFLTTSGIIWILLGVVLLFFRKTRAAGIILLSALLVGFLTGDVLLKHLVNRPRPFVVNTNVVLAIKPPTTASFPRPTARLRLRQQLFFSQKQSLLDLSRLRQQLSSRFRACIFMFTIPPTCSADFCSELRSDCSCFGSPKK